MDLCHPLGSMLSHYCFPKVSGLTVRKHFKRLTKPTIGSAVSLSFSAIHNPRCVFTFPFIYSWKCPRPSYLLFIYFLQLIIFNSWEGTSFFLFFLPSDVWWGDGTCVIHHDSSAIIYLTVELALNQYQSAILKKENMCWHDIRRDLPSELCPFYRMLRLLFFLSTGILADVTKPSMRCKVREGNPHAAQWHRPELCLSNQKGHTLETWNNQISRMKVCESEEWISRKGQRWPL